MIQEINTLSNQHLNDTSISVRNNRSNSLAVNFIDLLRNRMQPASVENNVNNRYNEIENNHQREMLTARADISTIQRSESGTYADQTQETIAERPAPARNEEITTPREEAAVRERDNIKEDITVNGSEDSNDRLEDSTAEENPAIEEQAKAADEADNNNEAAMDESITTKESDDQFQLNTRDSIRERNSSETIMDIPVEELTDSINQLLHSLSSSANGEENSREVESLLNDIRNLTRRLNREPDGETLKQTLTKLNTLMERLQNRNNSRSGRVMANLANILHRVNRQAEQNNQNEGSNQNLATEIKNLSAKIENLLNNLAQNGSNNSSEEGSQQNNNYSFNFLKNDSGLRRANVNVNSASVNRSFKQQMEEVIENARVSVRNNRNASVSLRLFPKDLGRMNVNLGLEQGIINGRFLVETEEARTLLMDNLESIREQLEESGIEVGEFQVNVSDQREGPDGSETDHTDIFISGLQNLPEISSEYDNNGAVHHNGEINLVI